jgi:fucokinase|tara:strand:+ start:1490 stop:4885 length:3396 start_codon:yes stop_codon:yes gene_type:complete
MSPESRDARANERATSRLDRFRALASRPDGGTFWDVVALTSSSSEQTRGFRARLDALHDAGALPRERERYVVITDPPGPRVGSGGATMGVARELKTWFGDAWREKRVFALHTGGHSERAPQYGTCGKAFADVPMDASGRGVPATILEAQLVQLTPLAKTLPPGIFVSSADVFLEYDDAQGKFDIETYASMERGITALGHPSSVAIGEEHGVFACDAEEVHERVRAMRAGQPSAPLECRKCLQKPSEEKMRQNGCVMRGYETDDDEWVLTDSCFHIGVDALEALIELDETKRDVLAGCEICAYGDFMQPLGRDADTSYLDRAEHLASVASTTVNENEARLRDARRAVAEALHGRPLIVIPLLPSRFIHLGTIPEFLYHTTKDTRCLRTLPAPSIPVRMAAVAEADFRQPEDSAIMSCRVRAGTTIGSGTCVVNCDVGKDVRIGDNCALYGVTLTAGSKVASNTFMYTLPVRKDARKGFVTIILNVDDVIKSRTSSTWCGIRVHDAIQRLGWSESRVWTDESHTTTLGRFFAVEETAEASCAEALHIAECVRGENGASTVARTHPSRVLSISQALRTYADHEEIMRAQRKLSRKIIGASLWKMLKEGIPANKWIESAHHLRSLTKEYEGSFLNAENTKNDLETILRGAASDEAGGSDDVQSTQFSLDIGRSALSLRVPHADEIARTCLRRVIVSSVVGTSLGMSAVADAERFTKVRAAYPARFNLAGGWTDTPPFCLERKGTVLHVAGLVDGELPIVATVTRLRTPGIRLAMKDAGSVDLRTDAYVSEDVRTIGDLLSHRDPTSAFALHKAVIMLLAVPDAIDASRVDTSVSVPRAFGQDADFPGIELASEVNLPKGSGLGTSSILAFAMVHALLDLRRGTAWKPLEGSLAAKVEYFDEAGALVAAPRTTEGELRDTIDAVLAVEQMLTTGGGWQDQVGGALERLRLSRSEPSGERLISYSHSALDGMSEATKAFINSRFACVFTGTVRLAKTVCDSVVTTWQRRDAGVETALTRCADLAVEMYQVFASLGSKSPEEIARGDGEFDIARLGALLETHKSLQQSLWPSIESPTIRAVYEALAPLSHGSFICGAGSGGHIIALLRSSATADAVTDAVRSCSSAPDARVVDVTLLL